MEIGIKTTLKDRELRKYLNRESIVFLDEWDPIDKIVYRIDVISDESLDSELVKNIKNFWLGMDICDVEVALDYEISIEDSWVYLNINFYETLVDGFIEGKMFEIIKEDDVIHDLIDEWKEYLSKYIEYTEIFD